VYRGDRRRYGGAGRNSPVRVVLPYFIEGNYSPNQLLPAPTNFLKSHYVFALHISLSGIGFCIPDVHIRNWVLNSGCTYLE